MSDVDRRAMRGMGREAPSGVSSPRDGWTRRFRRASCDDVPDSPTPRGGAHSGGTVPDLHRVPSIRSRGQRICLAAYSDRRVRSLTPRPLPGTVAPLHRGRRCAREIAYAGWPGCGVRAGAGRGDRCRIRRSGAPTDLARQPPAAGPPRSVARVLDRGGRGDGAAAVGVARAGAQHPRGALGA